MPHILHGCTIDLGQSRFDKRDGSGVECTTTEDGMSTASISTAVEELLKLFDLLPEVEKHEVTTEILRRSLELKSAPFTDEELALNAERVFLELDRRESEDGQSQSG